jgi:hypothetical protein
LAHLGVARTNALQSKTSQERMPMPPAVLALAACQDFFALGKDADSEIPILKQTQTEYAKLQ